MDPVIQHNLVFSWLIYYIQIYFYISIVGCDLNRPSFTVPLYVSTLLRVIDHTSLCRSMSRYQVRDILMFYQQILTDRKTQYSIIITEHIFFKEKSEIMSFLSRDQKVQRISLNKHKCLENRFSLIVFYSRTKLTNYINDILFTLSLNLSVLFRFTV